MEKVVISKLDKNNICKAANLIQSVHNEMLSQRKEFLAKEQDFEKYLEERMQDENYVLLSANIEDVVVGICTCQIKHVGDGDETLIRDILFIDYIAVDERYRRNKIGTKLLDKLKLYAMQNNIYTVELNVWGFNSSAIEFYEKNDMKQKRIIYEYIIDKER